MKNYKRASALFVMLVTISMIAGCGKSKTNDPANNGVGAVGAYSYYTGGLPGGAGNSSCSGTSVVTSFSTSGAISISSSGRIYSGNSTGGAPGIGGSGTYIRVNASCDQIQLSLSGQAPQIGYAPGTFSATVYLSQSTYYACGSAAPQTLTFNGTQLVGGTPGALTQGGIMLYFANGCALPM